MNPIAVISIGLAMSTDAFAAAIGKGAGMRKPRLMEALRVGLIFGTIEAITPAIGWLVGRSVSGVVANWDHWIALGLLSILGLHMIYVGLKQEDEQAVLPEQHGFWALAVAGFATSIDAMAVGVGLAFLDVNIAVVALVIGTCTVVMVTAGIMLGHMLGALVGKRAEIVGGVVLIAVGVAIAYEHTIAAVT